MKRFWKLLSITAALASLIAGVGAEIAKYRLRTQPNVDMAEMSDGELFFVHEEDGPTAMLLTNSAAEERRIEFTLNCAIISLISAIFYKTCTKKEHPSC